MERQGRVSRLAALVVICFCVLANSCPELDYLDRVGEWPDGPAQSVAVAGDYAYVGARSTLVVMDVSDPADPHVVGRVFFPNGDVRSIAVSGDYAYVAAGGAGFRVIDISTPSAPIEVGGFYLIATAVAVSGSHAYVLDNRGLRVIDISTPRSPLTRAYLETVDAVDVAASGDYAFVVSENGMKVIDVSTPTAPVQVGYVGIHNQVYKVAVSGDYAYLAAGHRGLRVIDVSDPYAPLIEAARELSDNSTDIAISGNYAYLLDDSAGFRVFDISTPPEPDDVGFAESVGALAIAVSGGHAYITAGSAGFRVVDVNTPSAPIEVGRDDWPDLGATTIAVEGDYAYVGDDEGGMFVLDVNPPFSPNQVGHVDTPAGISDVEALGGYAYLAAGESGLRVIDVSVPSAPFEVAFLDTAGPANHVAVSGGYAYVAAGDAGLRVIDVGAPSAPFEVAFVDTETRAIDVAVSGSYAYVVAEYFGLYIFDIISPAAPVEVGVVDLFWARSVAVSGDYAYVAGGDYEGFNVIDVRVPDAPMVVGSVGDLQNGVDIEVSGGYVYVANLISLDVVDVREPSEPIWVGTAETFGRAMDVAVSRGYVHVAAGTGVQIFEEAGISNSPDVFASFIPAAALAEGAEGAFFETEVEINNKGTEGALVQFQWLPSGEDNSEPIPSDTFFVEPGVSMQFPNALDTLFNLGPDSLGAIAMVADSAQVIGMSRTYNSASDEEAGTFGQSLPAVPYNDLIRAGETRRIIFMSQNPEARANLGCANGSSSEVTINVGLFDSEGTPLETLDLDLAPWSHQQMNRIFGAHAPVDGYVDVSTATGSARFFCYGSMLDNQTSDPTTILPQVPSDRMTFIPAAAVAAGAEGAFFQTDVDLNNTGHSPIHYFFKWLPRGQDNSSAVNSDEFSLGRGMGVRLANVLHEVFGLEPNTVGALLIVADSGDLLAMSRTYNISTNKAAGTFGQALPGVHTNAMISTGEYKRVIFMRENDEFRANLGCVNAVDAEVLVNIDLFDSDGNKLETKYMALPPMSNKRANRIFRDHAPVNGYVDIWTDTPGASIYCYGSVLDNVTNDPTTIPPQ